jgi:hypothetical protein
MLNLLIDLVLLGIVFGVLYAVYLIPPVKRIVRRLADGSITRLLKTV